MHDCPNCGDSCACIDLPCSHVCQERADEWSYVSQASVIGKPWSIICQDWGTRLIGSLKSHAEFRKLLDRRSNVRRRKRWAELRRRKSVALSAHSGKEQ